MIIAILIILGLAFGSFVNALVWRIHKQGELGDGGSEITKKSHTRTVPNSKLQTPNYSVLKGRSMCPNCKHPLGFWDLVPIFSWLYLKGKCRYCQKPISWQYPAVELLTAALFVASYVFWPYQISAANYLLIMFITWLVALVGLVALAVYDVKWMLLPDKIVYPLISIAATLTVFQFIFGRPLADIKNIALAVLIGGGLFWLLFRLSKGNWIGGGDIKLGFLLGLILGQPTHAVLYIFMASLLGLLYSLPAMLVKRLKLTSKVPFGPMLIAGAIITMLFGQKLIDWYLAIFAI